jgi:NAD(P)-dependent dehydrogenase (short-subunit alcohol dehydrogenase family)
MKIEGASALVTGAGRGIGRATALALAGKGAKVTLVSRTAADLEALAIEIRKAGGQALPFPGDVRDAPFAGRAVEAAVTAHGRLSVVVNNAGVGIFSPLAETSDAAWDTILGTNLTAVFRLTRAALPHLLAGGGHVFMISSLAGQNAIAGMSAYCASKAALDHLSACLMLEVRDRGVKVTVVAPGSVDTGFAGMPRPGDTSWMLTPDDVASAVIGLLETRDGAHLSRVEMRPARPQKRA